MAKAGTDQGTNGAMRCWELVQEIESPAANVAVERVWNKPWPSIRVHYRNVTQVHFRVIRDDWLAGPKSQALAQLPAVIPMS